MPYEVEENKRNFDNLIKAIEKIEKVLKEHKPS